MTEKDKPGRRAGWPFGADLVEKVSDRFEELEREVPRAERYSTVLIAELDAINAWHESRARVEVVGPVIAADGYKEGLSVGELDQRGSGFCYLALISRACVDEVVSMLGEWPSLADVLKLPQRVLLAPGILERRIVSCNDGRVHIGVGDGHLTYGWLVNSDWKDGYRLLPRQIGPDSLTVARVNLTDRVGGHVGLSRMFAVGELYGSVRDSSVIMPKFVSSTYVLSEQEDTPLVSVEKGEETDQTSRDQGVCNSDSVGFSGDIDELLPGLDGRCYTSMLLPEFRVHVGQKLGAFPEWQSIMRMSGQHVLPHAELLKVGFWKLGKSVAHMGVQPPVDGVYLGNVVDVLLKRCVAKNVPKPDWLYAQSLGKDLWNSCAQDYGYFSVGNINDSPPVLRVGGVGYGTVEKKLPVVQVTEVGSPDVGMMGTVTKQMDRLLPECPQEIFDPWAMGEDRVAAEKVLRWFKRIDLRVDIKDVMAVLLATRSGVGHSSRTRQLELAGHVMVCLATASLGNGVYGGSLRSGSSTLQVKTDAIQAAIASDEITNIHLDGVFASSILGDFVIFRSIVNPKMVGAGACMLRMLVGMVLFAGDYIDAQRFVHRIGIGVHRSYAPMTPMAELVVGTVV